MHACPQYFVLNTMLNAVDVGTCVSQRCRSASLAVIWTRSARTGLAEIWLLLLPPADTVSAHPDVTAPLLLCANQMKETADSQVMGAGLCLSESVFLELDIIAGIIWYPYSSELRMCWWGNLLKKISLPRPLSADIKVNRVATVILWNVLTI